MLGLGTWDVDMPLYRLTWFEISRGNIIRISYVPYLRRDAVSAGRVWLAPHLAEEAPSVLRAQLQLLQAAEFAS